MSRERRYLQVGVVYYMGLFLWKGSGLVMVAMSYLDSVYFCIFAAMLIAGRIDCAPGGASADRPATGRASRRTV